MNPEIMHYVQEALRSLRDNLIQSSLLSPMPLPEKLFYLTSAEELKTLAESGSLKAGFSRFGDDLALHGHAATLLRQYLGTVRPPASDPAAQRFCQAVNLNVQTFSSSHFESFMARFFACPDPDLKGRRIDADYSLQFNASGLAATRHEAGFGPGFLLESAIYDVSQQRAIVDELYRRHEACCTEMINWLPSENDDSITLYCWDHFRAMLGDVLPRFRPAELEVQQEWIGSLPGAPEEETRPITERLAIDCRNGMFLPYLPVPLAVTRHGRKRLPIEAVIVSNRLRTGPAKEGLQAFLRVHGLFSVVIR